MEMKFKRFLSMLLALTMVLSYVPFGAFATETGDETPIVSEETPSEPSETPSETPEGEAEIEQIADEPIETVGLNGAGTEAEPYQIGSAADLVLFRDSVNAGETKYNAPGVYVALTADIDMAGATWERGIGDGINASFDGIFDGKNFAVKNLNLAPVADSDGYFCGGLFGYTFGAVVIKNLVLENITVTATGEGHNVGALVGFANNKDGKLTVSNVAVKNVTINASGTYGVGAIVGYSYRAMGTIANCSVVGATITGHRFVGGITGYSHDNAIITGCSVNNAAITGEIGVGGVAGLASAGNQITGNTVANTTITASKNWGYVVGELGANTAAIEGNTAAAPQLGGSWETGEPYVAEVGDKYYATYEAALEAAKAGDEVVIMAAGSYAVPSGKDLTITATVDGVVFENIEAHGMNGANVTFNNVTFNYAENSTYKGLQHSGNLVYNNCTFNGQVFLYGESEIFNNCTFNTTDPDNYNVWTYGAKAVTFNGCTFNSAGKSVLVYNEGSTSFINLKVEDTTFNASQAVEGKAAIEIDTSLTDGANIVIDADTTATGFGSGNVSGNSLWNNKKGNETAANNDITIAVGGTTVLKPIVLGLNGEGTAASPYMINNLEELVWFQKDVNGGNTYQGKVVKLNADIDLGSMEWAPLATFNGIFDGDNHTISNLVISGNNSNAGFFGRTNDGEIKNLTFHNAKVSGHQNVGVVAGTPYTSKYTNITVSGHVEVNGFSYVGGVGGKNAYANWTDITVNVDGTSYVKATSTTAEGKDYRTYVGGVIGFIGEGSHTFKNITSNIAVIGNVVDVGGITGIAHYGNNFVNVTCTGTVTNTNSNDPADETETGGIAGVWHNEAGQTVTFTNVEYEGTVIVNNEDVTATNSVVGGAYKASNDTVENSGSLVIDGNKVWPVLAKIGDKEFGDLQAAVDAAQDGDTITLLCDISEGEVVIGEKNNGKKITLDLNGKTFTSTVVPSGYAFAINVYSSEVTIKNGTIVTNNGTGGVEAAYTGAVLTLENVTVDANGTSESNKNYNGSAVSCAANATVIINSGSYSSEVGCGVIQKNSQGAVTINGGTFTTDSQADQIAAVRIDGTWSGDPVTHMTINGGTFEGKWAFYSTGYVNDVAINGGTFNGMIDAQYADIYINGGTFNGKIIQSGGHQNNYVISGGTYTEDVSAWCAEGYVVKQNADGTYGLKAEKEAWILRNGMPKYYGSLAEAVADAQAGETIMLCANVEISELIDINKNITIADYGNLTVSSAGNGAFHLVGAAQLTIDKVIVNVPVYADNSESGAAVNGQAVTGVASQKSTLVCDGTAVTVNNPAWAAKIGATYYMTIDEALNAAVAGDEVVIFAGEYNQGITVNKAITVIGETDAEGNNLVKLNGGISITANGATVKGLNFNNGGSSAGYIGAKDVLVEDCTVVGGNGFRSCYTSGTVTFKDSTITGATYGIHFDGNAGGEIVIDNCVITGWTSFAATIKKVTMTDTTFAEGSQNYIRFYQDADISGCTFNKKMVIDISNDVSADVNVNTSTFAGGSVENLFAGNDIVKSTITVDGEKLVRVARVANKYYETVEEAFAAVQNGGTIELYADVTMQNAYDVNNFELNIIGTGKLTLNDKLTVSGESILNISAPMAGEVILNNGAILKDSTISGDVFVAGKVIFRGDNTVNMLYDYGTLTDYYGTEANMEWSVEPGASLTIVNKARYGLGYGDNVTIKGELTDAMTARDTLTGEDASFFTHGLVAQESNGWNCDSSLTVEDAYVIIGKNSSFGNKPGNYGGVYTFNFKNAVLDASRITFYEALSTTEFNMTGTDAKIGQFMLRDKDSVFTLTNSKLLSTATSNGNDEGNYVAGKLVLVNSELTYSAPVVLEGGIFELDINSSITAPSISGTGKIVIDASNYNGAAKTVVAADLTGFTGEVEVIGAVYDITADGIVIEGAVASIGDAMYATLSEALAAVKTGETIELLPVAQTEGATIKLPASLKNVTIKGAEGAVLKNTTIMAADGNSISYEGLTFDGITFENSRITLTGWRTGGASIKDLTVTNCVFKNLNDSTSSAPVHINLDASEAVENFTFTNNVIDGATGGSKSGVYAQATGNVTFTGNVINNVAFRPYIIQITTDDGIADNFVVTGNTFSGSAAGRAQGLGNNAEGTDNVNLVVSGNIFKGITNAQQICYWNFNEETTTADLSKNYYDIDILNNPTKIYYNSAAQNAIDLMDKGVYPYYADEAMTELVQAPPAIMVTYPAGNPVYPDGKIEYYNDMLEAVPYTTNCPRLEGATITLLADVSGAGMRFMENDMVFDLNGHVYTITAGTGSQGSNTSGFQIRPEVTTKVTFKNGTIQVAEGAPVVWMFNNYATNFVVEDVTVDCANMAYSYGESCYVHVSRSGDNTVFTGDTQIINYNSEVAGNAINVGGTMTIGENVSIVDTIELDANATLNAREGLNVVTVDGYKVVYANGVYTSVSKTSYVTTKAELDAAIAEAIEGDVIILANDIDYGTAQLKIEKPITLDLGGNTLTTGNNYGGMSLKGNPTIKNGNIVHVGRTAAIKAWNVASIENVNITVAANEPGKTIGGIVIQSGSTNRIGSIKNVTIQGEGLTNGIETYNCGDATDNVIGSMENVTINAKGTGMLISAPCGTATNCSINGGKTGVELWIKGTYSATLDLVDCAVTGGEKAVYVHDEFSSNPDIVNNGELKLTADEATTFESASGAPIAVNIARAENVDRTVIDELIETTVARVGDTYYRTLDQALTAAQAGDEVVIFAGEYNRSLSVTKDITVIGEGEVNFNGKLSITGNGATVKGLNFNNGGSSAGYIGAKDVLVEDCTVVGGNGFRSCYTSGTVTFKDSTITGATYGIHFDGNAGGEIVIDNCVITGWTSFAATIEKVTMTDTTFAEGNYNYIRFYQDAEISGCTFNEKMAVDVSNDVSATVQVTNSTVVNGTVEELFSAADIDKSDIYVDGELLFNAVAVIGGVEYPSLAAAIAAVKNGETIVLVDNCAEEVTVKQTAGKSFTIDGNGNTFTGTIHVTGYKGTAGAETLTIQNVNFVLSAKGQIGVHASNYAHDITVDGCSFTGTEGVITYGVKLENAYDITVKNVTGSDLFDLVYSNKTVDGFVAENIEATNVSNGFYLSYAKNASFKNVKVVATEAGVGINNYNASTATFENCDLTAKWPVYLQSKNNANAYKLIFNGTNTMTPATEGDAWLNVDNSSAKFKVTLNDTGLDGNLMTNMVAKVGNSYYNSLQYAIADAESGATVTLMKDIAIDSVKADVLDGQYATYFKVAGKTLTVDMNGKTISGSVELDSMLVGVFSTEDDGHLTLTGNGTVEIDAVSQVYCLIANYDETSTMVIENGTYKLDEAIDSLVYSGGDDALTVNGGYFELGNVGDGTNGKPWIFNVLGGNERNVIVTGGTYNSDISKQYWYMEIEFPANKAVVDNGNGTWSVVGANVTNGKQGYMSLTEAVAAAEDGDVITVLASHEITAPAVVNNSITIDLGGNILTGKDVYPVIRVQNNAYVTIDNGVITNDDYVFVLGASDGSSYGYLTILGGNYHGETTVASVTKGELVVEGGYFSVKSYDGEGYQNFNYLLNCVDANYAYGDANIVVKGGSFENFNPADNAAEGLGTNFVDSLYEATTTNGVVWNVNAIAAGEIPENPIYVEWIWNDEMTEATATVSVPANATYYFAAYISGMEMTINGELYGMLNGSRWMPASFTITNDGDAEATYELKISYPIGSQGNPAELVIGDNTATIEAGNDQGYFFTYTADADGVLTITMPEGGWTYVINNLTTYQYGDMQWSDSDPVVNPAIVEFAEGDELQIVVNNYDPANPWNTPAGELTINVADGYPAGHEQNPIDLTADLLYENDFSATVTVPAGETYNFVAYRVGGMIMSINGGEGVACVTTGMWYPYAWTITNDGAEAAEYVITVSYPIGNMQNPAQLVIGDNTASIEADSQGYCYTWTAEEDGELFITMPEGDWTYVINNMTTYQYGDTQWSDSDPVVNPGVVSVNKGDEIQIMVNTYDPANPWGAPAGELTVTAEFVAAPGTQVNPIGLFKQQNTVTAEGTSYDDVTYYFGYFNNMLLTVEGEGDFAVIYNGESVAAVDGKVEMTVASSNPRMPVYFAIDGNGDYAVNVGYPVGNMENAAQLVIGDNTASIEAGNFMGYFFSWTADKDGVLIITMPEGDWMYAINNLTAYQYGDTQWSDSDPVVNPAYVNVSAGDEIQIMVNSYDPANMWSNPAAEITFVADFMVPVAKNETTGKIYGSVAEALATAKAGQTVVLTADASEDMIFVRSGITLDLNGYTLTASDVAVVNSAHIVDNSAENTGLLAVDGNNVMISRDNKQLPVRNGNGYIFVDVDVNSRAFVRGETVDGFTYMFQPVFEETARLLLADGAADNELTIEVRVSWDTEKTREYRNLVFNEAQIKAIIGAAPNGAFVLNFSGFKTVDAISGVTVETVINTVMGVSVVSNGHNVDFIP